MKVRPDSHEDVIIKEESFKNAQVVPTVRISDGKNSEDGVQFPQALNNKFFHPKR